MKYPEQKILIFKKIDNLRETLNWLYDHLQCKTIRYFWNIFTLDFFVFIRPTKEELTLIKLSTNGQEYRENYPPRKLKIWRPSRKKM